MNTSVRMNPLAKKAFAFLTLLAMIVSAFPVPALAVDVNSFDVDVVDGDNISVDIVETVLSNISGCTNPLATNYDPAATVDDGSCIATAPVLFCADDSALNFDQEGECIYDDGREVITACKYSSTEEPIEGWGILITNDVGDDGDVTFDDLVTEEDGCVSVAVYPEDGPFYVAEEDREGWTQEEVLASEGQVFEGEGTEYCEFFDDRIIVEDFLISALNLVIDEEAPDYRCDFYNQEVPVEVDLCNNIDGAQTLVPEGMERNEAGNCAFPEVPQEIINTCLVPSTLGDDSEFVINNSGEKTVAEMLADHGYVAINTTNDQINYQVWNLVDPTADTITFNLKVLGKRAGNTQILGYYKAGDGSTFASVLTQISDTDGEVVVPVTIPAIFATSFGFGIKSDDMTWFSEKSLNSDTKDHVAVYNPAANTYLLAFEDFNNLGDADYNDLVVEIADVKCVQPPPPVDMCKNIDGVQVTVPEGKYQNQAGDCLPLEEGEIINTCLVPNTLGDVSEFVVNNSGEKTVAEMLADHGYVAIDTTNDQINYQVWDLVDLTTDTITFNVKVLGKRAGNTQILGYYKAGDGSTFSSVLTQVSDTDGEVVVPVTIPAVFATSFGFGIKSDDMTWFSEKSLNSDAKDHVAVYNPASNTYLLAFEDFNNLGDGDYNDLVIEVADVRCTKSGDEEVPNNINNNDSSRGSGGSRSSGSSSRPNPQVAGDSISAPEPTPLVLGEQVTVVPYGAPATGRGGSSTNNQTYLGLILAIILAGMALKRREKKA